MPKRRFFSSCRLLPSCCSAQRRRRPLPAIRLVCRRHGVGQCGEQPAGHRHVRICDAEDLPGLSVQLQHSAHRHPDSDIAGTSPGGQAFTFSYEGGPPVCSASPARLHPDHGTRTNATPGPCSSAWIRSAAAPSTRPFPGTLTCPGHRVDEDLTLQLGNTAMLLKNPFDTEGGLFSCSSICPFPTGTT